MQKEAVKAILTEIFVTIIMVLLANLGIPIPPILQFFPIWFPIATSILFKAIIHTWNIFEKRNMKKSYYLPKNSTIRSYSYKNNNKRSTCYHPIQTHTNQTTKVRIRKR